MEDELKNKLVNLLEGDLSNKEEFVEQLLGMLNNKNLEKVAKILKAYSQDPETFRKMFGENEILEILKQL